MNKGFEKVAILLALGLTLFIIFLFTRGAGATSDNTCPPTGSGWTKIDSNDLSLYPVSGATQYCFKAGSGNANGCTGGKFDAIPQGGFTQPYCGLSHWSYYVPSTTPTPTDKPCGERCITPTDIPTATPTSTPSATPTTAIPTPITHTNGGGDGKTDGKTDGLSDGGKSSDFDKTFELPPCTPTTCGWK